METRKFTKEEVEQWRREHRFGLFYYYNKEDSNIYVHVGFGIGYEPNLANPLIRFVQILGTFIFIIAILCQPKWPQVSAATIGSGILL